MKHRHIDDKTWTKAALFSLFERGSREDWIELSGFIKSDKTGKIKGKLLAVAKELGHDVFGHVDG
jgi:hypothetical protein